MAEDATERIFAMRPKCSQTLQECVVQHFYARDLQWPVRLPCNRHGSPSGLKDRMFSIRTPLRQGRGYIYIYIYIYIRSGSVLEAFLRLFLSILDKILL